MLTLLLALTLSPAQLFTTLEELKRLNLKDPTEAAILYEEVREHLPKKPSLGVYKIHRRGLESAVRTRNRVLVSDVISLLQEPSWDYSPYLDKSTIIGHLAIFHRKVQNYNYAEHLYHCALSYAPLEIHPEIINNLSVLLNSQGKYTNSKELLIRAMNLSPDNELSAYLENNFGNALTGLGEHQNASNSFKTAFLYHQGQKNWFNAAAVGLNLLNSYIQLKQWGNLKRYYKTVSVMIEKANILEMKNALLWQNAVYIVATNKAINSELLSQLNESLPQFTHSEFSTNIKNYTHLIKEQFLIERAEKLLDTTIKDEKEIPSIKISLSKWCHSR